jgi:hypothetical protein
MGKLQLRVQHITRRSKLLLVDFPLPHEAEELQLLHTAVALMMMKTYSSAKPLAIDLAPHNLVHEKNNMGIRPKCKSLSSIRNGPKTKSLLEHPKSTHIPHTHSLTLSLSLSPPPQVLLSGTNSRLNVVIVRIHTVPIALKPSRTPAP